MLPKARKRFGEEAFTIPGHVVLAGPNNTGKTTLLQAVAAWELGLRKWTELGNFNSRRHGSSGFLRTVKQGPLVELDLEPCR